MAITSDISDRLTAGIKALFGNTLRRVDTHPGQWSDSAVKLVVNTAPAVYVAWLGSRQGEIRNTAISSWGIFVSAKVLNGRQTDVPGIYQIVERLTGWLNNRRIAPAGTFTLTQVTNLWSDTQSQAGVAVYGLYFDAPQPLPDPVDPTGLDDYATHYQQWAQPDGTPEQEALIPLPTQETP
ncbi:Mu-like prophage FluMu protein [Xenorhabdus nematophila ATCC 19061]|uniref:Mu-like prophage FluMu protein n=1 Tax=Xenorhabdus nematophila (strain ATCC 19061 / DSM 3370 / CCUG 14189 / LMG 1036 / NCIMB 9965 / AN6) TaxID=406817 RepID=D3V984_XENNA|nr:phage protein Gp37 [Xenorhabdus nematophila]CBJ91434.1 Mu-like prophage FluMu protein [Xenorhabdus nematophila ATCC 19061]CEK24255.1 Mu-like prophage FluMu protein [Xenorhabdus nematophila AN6/1]